MSTFSHNTVLLFILNVNVTYVLNGLGLFGTSLSMVRGDIYEGRRGRNYLRGYSAEAKRPETIKPSTDSAGGIGRHLETRA